MMVIDNKFEISQTVYLKTDKNQLPRIVYGFIVYPGELLYKLVQGDSNSEHYEFELSLEPNLVLKVE